MDITTPRRNAGRFWTEKYVAGMEKRGELIPGGADAILAMIPPGSPVESLAHLGKLFADPNSPPSPGEAAMRASMGLPPGARSSDPTVGAARKFLNVERQADGPEAPLRAVIRRFGLSEHHASTLYSALAADLAGKDEGAALVAVHRALISDEHRHRDPWPQDPMTRVQERVKGILATMKSGRHLRHDVDVDSLARKWGTELGNGASDRPSLYRSLIARLTTYPDYWPNDGEGAPKFDYNLSTQLAIQDREETDPARSQLANSGRYF